MTPAAADLRAFLHTHTGVHLDEDKDYLVVSRLRPLLDPATHADLGALARAVQRDPRGALALRVIDALTTHETSWFRDTRPFDLLRDRVLPALRERRAPRWPLSIWSAACSTGQEPYSIAMTLSDAGWGKDQFRVLASDISLAVLERARQGVYSDFELQRGLPDEARRRHFQACGSHWTLAPGVRDPVRFQAINLLETSADLGSFDVIFCRNVLIYFDEDTRAQVLSRLRERLEPDGFLFLGAAESPRIPIDGLRPCPQAPGLFQRSGGWSQAPDRVG